MTNGRYVDIENEVLRNRLKQLRDAILDMTDTVDRYTNGRALRSELLNKTAACRRLAEGKG